jgi:protein-L-isoaspartate(D-aspartate) O-methyltransferase
MVDFEQARENMVDCQVRTSDVTQHQLIAAMLSVPREAFVSQNKKPFAYIDEDLSLSGLTNEKRYLMQAASFAKLVQAAKIDDDDVALIVGTASGYSSAVFSLLCNSVVAIEQDKALAEYASTTLSELGYVNVAVLQSELSKGYPSEAPYDVILIEGAIERLPETILEQLAEGGRLVCVEGQGNAALAKLYIKKDGLISDREIANSSVKPLPGFEKEKEFTF